MDRINSYCETFLEALAVLFSVCVLGSVALVVISISSAPIVAAIWFIVSLMYG